MTHRVRMSFTKHFTRKFNKYQNRQYWIVKDKNHQSQSLVQAILELCCYGLKPFHNSKCKVEKKNLFELVTFFSPCRNLKSAYMTCRRDLQSMNQGFISQCILVCYHVYDRCTLYLHKSTTYIHILTVKLKERNFFLSQSKARSIA